MLILTRRTNEKVIIGENVTITVVEIGRGRVRIGIEAPRDVVVYRSEIAGQFSKATGPSEAIETAWGSVPPVTGAATA